MTITKHKNVSEVTYFMFKKKNTETDSVNNGNECTMPKADHGAAPSCCKAVVCKVPVKPPAKTSTASGPEAIDSNGANRQKEQINVKLNLSKANKCNVAQSTQTNALKMRYHDPEPKRERANESVNEKNRGIYYLFVFFSIYYFRSSKHQHQQLNK